QQSFEGSVLTGDEAAPSVFTGELVRGLESGEADRDGDGIITVDEIYDYVHDRVRDITPKQTPSKWVFNMQGSLHLSRRPSGPAPAFPRPPARSEEQPAGTGRGEPAHALPPAATPAAGAGPTADPVPAGPPRTVRTTRF